MIQPAYKLPGDFGEIQLMPNDAPVSLQVAESIGLTAMFASAAIAWYLFNRLDNLPGKMEDKMEGKLADIWQVITANDKATQNFRERMLERLADVPTNAAMASMEQRIMSAINRGSHHVRD